MKEGWEYKKFEDALLKVKYTRKIQNSDYLPNGIIPVVSQEETFISGFWNNRDDAFKVDSPVVIFGDHSRVVKYVDFDFVLGADGVKILKPIDGLNARFFYHFLKWYDVPSLGYSRHYKLLKEINVPIPPLSEQQHIVEELDLLSSIIEKKKAQLNELDNLAQSLFYEMFGDPITNEKGWDVKPLGKECTELKYGTSKPACENGKYKYLRMGNLTINGELDLSNLKTIDIPDDEVEKCIVRYGDILFNRTNSLDLIGKTCMFNLDEPMVIAGYIIRVRLSKNLNPRYISAMLNIPRMKLLLKKMAKGAVNQANINSKELASIITPIPPLDLQNQFSERIHTIEHQKELIKQSIKEVETLFNSRMDYYFN